MRQSGDDKNRRLASWMLGYSEVLSSALLMVLPAVLGIACDSWLGTSPWCVVVGAVIGLCGGLLRLSKLPGSVTRPHRSQPGSTGFGVNASQRSFRSPEVGGRDKQVFEPESRPRQDSERSEI